MDIYPSLTKPKIMIENEILLNYSNIRGLFCNTIKYGMDYFNSFKSYGVMEGNTELNNELIRDFMNGSISAEEAIESIDYELYQIFRLESNVDWEEVFCLLGRNNVFGFFNLLKDELSDEDYWMILGFCYTTSDFAFESSDLLREMFQVNRSNKEFLMNEEDRGTFNNLPQQLTIYRGCSKKEIDSNQLRFSWTLNKEIAEFFAYKYKRNLLTPCSVITKTISKYSVTAYFNDRNEEEILWLE